MSAAAPAPSPDLLAIAAVVSRRYGDADRAVAAATAALRRDGWRVRGLLQAFQPAAGNCRIELIDLDDDSRHPITQELGSSSEACCLDTARLADASAVMRRIAIEGADLAVFNRFGGLEAEGAGFAAEMLDLMSAGIPVVAIVPERHLAAWREFTGHLAAELEPDPEELKSWFLRARLPA